MKAFICLVALFAVANAGYLGAPAAIVSTGTSSQVRNQDGLGNYNFAYNEQHATGGTTRQESGNALGQVVGSYSLGVVDGRRRVVNYVADALGFRAAISTNEPGTKAQAAAATSIAAPGLVAAAPAIAAPVAVAAPAYAGAIAAPAYAGAIAAPAYGPALAAPVAVAAPAYAPVAKVIAPAVSGYSSVVNHAAIAAPVAVAAPVAKVAVAGPAIGAYSTGVLAGPAIAPW